MSGTTPEPVIEAVLNAAETWLAGPTTASPPGTKAPVSPRLT